ncbi:MAG: ChbG/HpnK family deacetylase [Bryobacteraceae bacterium]|nr:ChbG/HpnK family deacetylase [Bryobacteraceae bacterium]
MTGRVLIVNADDFGFTRDVNAGIIEAHREGILTATTLMANGRAFEDAVRLAKETPALDVGCHLVLVGGHSLLDPGRRFPGSVGELLRAVATKRLDAYRELGAQVEKVLQAGLRPVHLDTHKHTHLFPPVLSAVARLSEEYGIPWVRRPFDLPLAVPPGEIPWTTRAVSGCLGFVRAHFHRVLGRHGCRTTDHFAGFQLTGRFDGASLARLIEALPEGTTEFMCHPGHCTAELRGARTRLRESREEELRALKAPEVREAVQRANVRLARFSELP